MTSDTQNPAAPIAETAERIRKALHRVVVGQDTAIDEMIITLLAGGHALLTGVPGLGKTLLVKSLAQLFSLSFKRIQFTPDLMPADIFGTEVMEEDVHAGTRSFRFIPGPVFANMVLADEINRTPPKTQAALLEAMGEGHVTTGGKSYPLEQPFFVLATQNPVELSGTYPLPEAQLDRFLMNIVIDYLPVEDEIRMVKATTGEANGDLEPVVSQQEILQLQRMVREVPASDNVVAYAVRLCAATRPHTATAAPRIDELVHWGAGSRAAQALILAGKARALLQGRLNVACEDVKALALPVLRHRVIPSFRAEAENISVNAILEDILRAVKE